MKRWTILSAASGAILLAGLATDVLAQQLENLPAGMEGLRGRHWHGSECCNWSWDWTQVSGPIFRGVFQNKNGQRLAEDDIQISIHGNSVTITRKGGSGAGGCTYVGTIRPGGAEGNYSCAGKPAGTWAATISQTP